MDAQTGLLAVLRGLHLAADLSLPGVAGFIAWILPAAANSRLRVLPALVRLWRIAGIVALVTGMAWFCVQAAVIADAADLSDLWDALPIVAGQTRYGQMMLLRGVLLVGATLLAGSARWRLYPAILLSAAALALQGVIGHAGATGGAAGGLLVTSESLHLLAAGLWLGALLPLWLSLGRLPAEAAAAICERFTPVGLGCVLVIAGSGLLQAMALIGGIPALAGTPYGHIALVKIGLFLIALVLAAINRLWLTDRLAHDPSGGTPERVRRELRLSVSVETLVGLGIVLAAGWLASTSPGIHDQPVWPFPWRFSLVTVNEDPDLLTEMITSCGLIGVAILLLAAALVRGRMRLGALALLAGVLVWRGPSLSLLTVEAYPTSFQTSPTRFAAASIAAGQALYAANCVACHGAGGAGDGPVAASLHIRPADLTMPHLWEHSDGELMWWLTHGIDDPEGGLAMPGFAALSEADRWALIDYIRAHNVGVALTQDAVLPVPVAAPSFPIRCDGLAAADAADLRGRAVYVVTAGAAAAIPAQSGVPVVTLDLRADSEAVAPGACVAATPAAWQAYAVLADLTPAELGGAEFLIDPNGWLRAEHRPNAAGGWHTREQLIAVLRGICANPIQQTSGGEHEHHH